MPFLTSEEIAELSSPSLTGRVVRVVRADYGETFSLNALVNHGMKGVVWRGRNQLGESVAIKLIPSKDYANRALIDEMADARKLDAICFATIFAFGTAEFANGTVSGIYKCIVTEWVEGAVLSAFTQSTFLTVDDFIALARQMFTALAVLKRAGLCHEDLHPGNLMLLKRADPLSGEPTLLVKIIDTGTIKSLATRTALMARFRTQLADVAAGAKPSADLAKFVAWKEPDDHLRIVECLLLVANAVVRNYHALEFWERRFMDRLDPLLARMVEEPERRLDDPYRVIQELIALKTSSRRSPTAEDTLTSPFDYISAEMIQSDTEFASLYSSEFPWLNDCKAIQPLYIYGPRGCGKSSVLRWLSLKVRLKDAQEDVQRLREVGIYVSCSVELRSRFWLLSESTIELLQADIIRYFVMLLLEELFDTLSLMRYYEEEGAYTFGLAGCEMAEFVMWFQARAGLEERASGAIRLQGQDYFSFLRGTTRKDRWLTWKRIQTDAGTTKIPDPSLLSDVCRELSQHIPYLQSRVLTFLIDDYSNQRIPPYLQRKLNQTISFAKAGVPLFKVSSEYDGVDLEGIQEGREVSDINVGERYTSLPETGSGTSFLADILDKRLAKAGYSGRTAGLLGKSEYDGTLQAALYGEAHQGPRVLYYGLEVIHQICSGDLALALDMVRRIFLEAHVDRFKTSEIAPRFQHKVIQRFSAEEVERVKHIVPFGADLHQVLIHLGFIATATVRNKLSLRTDRSGEPQCKTHLDVRLEAMRELGEHGKLRTMYSMLTSRAILFPLDPSRSRLEGLTERLQVRRVYLPAFHAPLKRDVPIKIDSGDDLKSLLSNPRKFAERELLRSDVDTQQLSLLERELVEAHEDSAN